MSKSFYCILFLIQLLWFVSFIYNVLIDQLFIFSFYSSKSMYMSFIIYYQNYVIQFSKNKHFRLCPFAWRRRRLFINLWHNTVYLSLIHGTSFKIQETADTFRTTLITSARMGGSTNRISIIYFMVNWQSCAKKA